MDPVPSENTEAEQTPEGQRAMAPVRQITVTLFGAVPAIARSDLMRGLKDFGSSASGGNPTRWFHSYS